MATLLLCAVIAQGDIKTFTGSVSNDFYNGGNWSPTGMPTADDRIVIPINKICNVVEDPNNVDEFTIDTMRIDSGGTLTIADGITLILENDDDNLTCPGDCPTLPDHSIVDATVNVGELGGGIGGTLVVKSLWVNEHVFSGDGAIKGIQSGNVIEVQQGKSFVNLLSSSSDSGILNTLTIQPESGTATLSNEGRVLGDGGDIVLAAGLILEDVPGAVWGLDDCDSSITFQRPADLQGDFIQFAGSSGSDGGGTFVLDFTDDKLTTCRTYIIENPCPFRAWVLGSGASFEYAGFNCGVPLCSTCGNPCNTCPHIPVCTSAPYVIDTNYQAGNCF